jgi:transcription-repair coupling factor (superfamily II helicase)
LGAVGAGFALAEQDMDLRGAGNVLGDEQSGYIKDIGLAFFEVLFEQAVRMIRDGRAANAWDREVSVNLPVSIPASYIPDETVRLYWYDRIARESWKGLEPELVGEYGPIPVEVNNLLRLHRLRRRCEEAGLERVEAGPKGAVIRLHQAGVEMCGEYQPYLARAQAIGASATIRDGNLITRADWRIASRRLSELERLVGGAWAHDVRADPHSPACDAARK